MEIKNYNQDEYVTVCSTGMGGPLCYGRIHSYDGVTTDGLIGIHVDRFYVPVKTMRSLQCIREFRDTTYIEFTNSSYDIYNTVEFLEEYELEFGRDIQGIYDI